MIFTNKHFVVASERKEKAIIGVNNFSLTVLDARFMEVC